MAWKVELCWIEFKPRKLIKEINHRRLVSESLQKSWIMNLNKHTETWQPSLKFNFKVPSSWTILTIRNFFAWKTEIDFGFEIAKLFSATIFHKFIKKYRFTLILDNKLRENWLKEYLVNENCVKKKLRWSVAKMFTSLNYQWTNVILFMYWNIILVGCAYSDISSLHTRQVWKENILQTSKITQ